MVGVLNGTQDVLPITVRFRTPDGSFAFDDAFTMKAILTGFTVSGKSNLQVGHSLRQKIHYTVVGGERATPLTLSGVWFAGVCPGEGEITGVDTVVALYEACRISTSGAMVEVHIARTLLYRGPLFEFTARLLDPDTGVGEFQFNIIPAPRYVTLAVPGTLSPQFGSPFGPLSSSALAGVRR